MKRVFAISMAVLMVLTLGAGAVAARGHRPAEFVFRAAQHAHPHGWFRVEARVKRAQPDMPFSVTAVIHFASGDMTVDLTRRNDRYVAVGRVRVPDAEYGGAVPVDFTLGYGDTVNNATVNGNVDGPPAPPPDDDPPPQDQ